MDRVNNIFGVSCFNITYLAKHIEPLEASVDSSILCTFYIIISNTRLKTADFVKGLI